MKKLQYLFMSLAAMLLATPAFAQEAAGGHPENQWIPLAAALGMAIAAGLCGLGQGRAVAAAVEAMGRQPGAASRIQTALIIGLALIESLAIYVLVVAMILLFVQPIK